MSNRTTTWAGGESRVGYTTGNTNSLGKKEKKILTKRDLCPFNLTAITSVNFFSLSSLFYM